MELGLNPQLYPWLNPDTPHPSDADAEALFASAFTDSPWLEEWSRRGGYQNWGWASGLESDLHYEVYQTCSIGVAVLDSRGWRGSGILGVCGHTIEIKVSSAEWAGTYLNFFPWRCPKCERLEREN